MKFKRTVIMVEVLSPEDTPVENMGLKRIADEVLEGDCSGKVVVQSVDIISSVDCARIAKEQGTEPEFFGIDSNGNEI